MTPEQLESASRALALALGTDPDESIPHRDILTGQNLKFSPRWRVLSDHIKFHHMIDLVREQAPNLNG